MNAIWHYVQATVHLDTIIYYQFYQLGTGGRTQKAKPVRGVYLKPLNESMVS